MSDVTYDTDGNRIAYRRKAENPERRGQFLDAILNGASIANATLAAGLSTNDVFLERRRDPDFDRQVIDALEVRGDLRHANNPITPAVKEQILDYIVEHKCMPDTAAVAHGISPRRLTQARHHDPDFDDELSEVTKPLVAALEDSLIREGLKGNVRAIETALYNLAPDKWATGRTIDRRAKELDHAAAEEVENTPGAETMTLKEKRAAVTALLSEIATRTERNAAITAPTDDDMDTAPDDG